MSTAVLTCPACALPIQLEHLGPRPGPRDADATAAVHAAALTALDLHLAYGCRATTTHPSPAATRRWPT